MSDAPFTQRLKAFNSRLAVDPSNEALYVREQMLVPVSAAPVAVNGIKPSGLGLKIQQYLAGINATPTLLTTVFAGLANPKGFDDVAILQLPPGQSVLSVVHGLRANVLTSAVDKGKATPNHVMIPAPNSDWCPYGGPSPANNPERAPHGHEGVDITIIDAGYMWRGASWGHNPLTSMLTKAVHLHEADWLHVNPSRRAATWQKGSPNVPDANTDKKLDALAGHANFVAGVIAQHVERPVLHIWNHNSAFVNQTAKWDNFSTEAAICRSLVMSQLDTQTPVIQIGHETTVDENIPSDLWPITFQRIGDGRNLDQDVILTCPAGNEGLLSAAIATAPRIPAAFGIPAVPAGVANPGPILNGPTYSWVKGVASHTGTSPSNFSNHGAWVTCSANGEYVVSCFLNVKMATEETPVTPPGVKPSTDFRPDAWAMWNGTSFAAPQVAGEIAAQLSPSVNAAQAWSNLTMCAGCAFVPGYGVVFQF